MDTEDIKNAAEETEPVADNPEPGDIIESQDNQEVQATHSEDPQAGNIREMRLRKERAERERDEAYILLQQMKAQTLSGQTLSAQTSPKQASPGQASPNPEPQGLLDQDDDLGIGADDLVEGKHLGKIVKEMKQLKKQLESYQQVTTSTTVETRLKQKYSDFDSVVSKDNVEALVRNYPELGATLRSSNDLYSQAVAAYTMIKNMGIYKKDTFVKDKTRAQENVAKPRPLTSVSPQQGPGALSKANAFAGGLTPELKAQLLREMNDAISRG